MADIDAFAASLLEEAKRFLEKATAAAEVDAQNAFLHSALLLAFCSLEAHLNAVCEELAIRPELSPHERGILLEKEVRLEDGEFELKGLRMYRIEDRLLFLLTKFSGAPVDRTATWRSELGSAIDLRNKLTHPKLAPPITLQAVERSLKAVIEVVDVLYQSIYRRGFPAANRGLHSRLNF